MSLNNNKPLTHHLPSGYRAGYDNKDYAALTRMTRERVDWTAQEDSLLLLCQVATKFLTGGRRDSLIPWHYIRDILHENIQVCGVELMVFSSADPKVSSAELMVLLICPSSVVVRRPSVNFCFKSLLLLQFLFDNSEFFTGETRHIVPPCNKAGISNFCLEFQKLQKFQIS